MTRGDTPTTSAGNAAKDPASALTFVCTGCGAELNAAGAAAVTPFACPKRDADHESDHVLVRVQRGAPRPAVDTGASHPFVRYRSQLSSWLQAEAAGWSRDDWAALVGDLDHAVAAVSGRPMARTPSVPLADVGPLDVTAKLELYGPAGSHKTRHVFGLMLWLLTQERLGRLSRRAPLAIASCGNAALAAATVARAAGWPIRVFVPTDVKAPVRAALADVGAQVVECPRVPGQRGDPTVNAFRAAVAEGALPFCCQGTDNGMTLEGGALVGWELAESATQGVEANPALATDANMGLWVQVGGGALGTGAWRGLLAGIGATSGLDVSGPLRPRLFTVQTAGAWPLGRAWLHAVAALLDDPGVAQLNLAETAGPAQARAVAERTADLAAAALDRVRRAPGSIEALDTLLAANWRGWMQPWPTTPHSVAHGILDDETYDGRALVRGMISSGGWPVVAGEDALLDAVEAAGGHPVTPTGSAGLAGLMQSHAAAAARLPARHVVLLTGLDRTKG